MDATPRETWGSQRGFILAGVGSAVGLGNMWRFPYATAENGGAAFVLLYLVLTLGLGLPLLVGELALGRRARGGPVAALVRIGGPRWRLVGWAFVCGIGALLAYYSVIGGWTLRYAAAFAMGAAPAAPEAFFERVASGPGAAVWHVVFLSTAAAVVARGVQGGIERLTRWLMPVFLLSVVAMGAYAATLEGTAAAYRYFLAPDFGDLLSPATWSRAAGQAFFSLSVGMGAMLTFGSYLPRAQHLPGAALAIAGADFAVALLAGLVVFPILFSFGLEASIDASAIGALFIALPQAFGSMASHGSVLGGLFFGALAVGALTSAIAILEVVVSALIEASGVSRRRATWGAASAIALVGLAPAFDLSVLSWMDRIAGELFVVAGGLALSLVVGFVMEGPIREVRVGAEGFRGLRVWHGAVRFPVPAFLLVMLVLSVAPLWSALRAMGVPG